MNLDIEPGGPSSRGVADSVLPLLRRQRDLYRKLQSLAERQRGLVAESDAAPLLAVLGDRQKVVEALTQVGQELAPHRDAWDQTRRGLTDGDRQEAERILGEVRAILDDVIAADEHDARLLSARKAQRVNALQTLRGDRRAVAAYAAAGAPRAAGRLSEES